jgi:hypothetical protein
VPESVSLPQLLSRATKLAAEDIATALPCKVVRYNQAKQTVDVRPCVRQALVDEENAVTYETLPDLVDVPVLFPSGGGFTCVFPLAAGDFVFVLFSELDFGQWRLRGDTPTDPPQAGKHLRGCGVALPCMRPTSSPLNIAAGTQRASIGKDGADARIEFGSSNIYLGKDADDYVALKSKVDACMDLIKTHTHAVVGAAASASTDLLPLNAGGSGSSLVKAK